MSPSYPEAAAKPGGGWRPFLLAALLAAGVVAPAAAPVAGLSARRPKSPSLTG